MFQIGDRVRLIKDHPDGNGSLHVGDTGTVCDQSGDGRPGVEWDVYFGGHDCFGNCRDGYGWYVYENQLEFAPIEEESDVETEDDAFSNIIHGGIQ